MKFRLIKWAKRIYVSSDCINLVLNEIKNEPLVYTDWSIYESRRARTSKAGY